MRLSSGNMSILQWAELVVSFAKDRELYLLRASSHGKVAIG